MWEFSVGLILLELHPASLALVALFGLVDSLAQVMAGPYVGAYVDRHARLPFCLCMAHPGLKTCYPRQSRLWLPLTCC